MNHQDDQSPALGRTADTVEIGRVAVPPRWLLEVGGDEQSECFSLQPGSPFVIGAGRSADLVIRDPAVSSRHCELCWTESGVSVRDLCSKNGLYVGSARVEKATLDEDGASFVIGHTTFTVRCESVGEDQTAGVAAVPGLIGASSPMRRVAEQIRRYARSKVAVLLQGESGTGKDVAARALHRLSDRSGDYVPLNVAAFPESLADSELFGHRRGAYTGALMNRPGAFEQAHRGTLFLDEVADLAPSVQAKLLRVVEDGVVRPIGASQPITVDVRIVSASFARLDQRVEEGRFRPDLFHRLATVCIHLPPLRQRRSDIPALSRALLSRMAADVGDKTLTSAALARLVDHTWPGNVRELSSVLYRAALADPGREIVAHHIDLPPALAPTEALAPEQARQLLESHGGNVSAAARAAGVPRSTFRGWLSRGS